MNKSLPLSKRKHLVLSAIGSIAILALAVIPLTSDSVSSAEARRVKPKRGLSGTIQTLASHIYHNVNRSQANREQLQKAKWHLEQAQALLNGVTSNQPNSAQACVQWAFPNYAKDSSSPLAREQAHENCTDKVDLRIAKLFYPYFAKSQGSSSAMDQALKASKQNSLAKQHQLIEFSLVTYQRSYKKLKAARETIRQVRQTGRGQFRCVEQNYRAYNRRHDSARALDEAFTACRGREP